MVMKKKKVGASSAQIEAVADGSCTVQRVGRVDEGEASAEGTVVIEPIRPEISFSENSPFLE